MSGFFGVVSLYLSCMHDLFYGTDYHSHMGKEHGGLCVVNKKGKWMRANHSVREVQFQPQFSRYLDNDVWKGKMGIGVISDFDVQPLVIQTRFGTIAIAFNGWIQNLPELIKRYITNGHSFIVMREDPDIDEQRTYSVSLLATLINEAKTIEAGIQHVWEIIEGSASIIVLTPDGIIAARDKYGRTPVAIAYNQTNNNWAVTSEDSFLFNLGYEVERFLDPGEIVYLDSTGFQTLCKGDCNRSRSCAFRYIYTSNPASGKVALTRLKSGKALAATSQLKGKFDLGFGVPDSGIFHGQGFCSEAEDIPYIQAIIKYTETWGRSYIPAIQAIRYLVAKYKLLAIPDLLKNKRIVMADDSIVRGTQLGDLIWVLMELLEVAGIHLAIACPPLLFPCNYLFSTRRRVELVARRAIGDDVDDIAPYIDPDSSKYKKMIREIKILMLRGKEGGDRWNLPSSKIDELLPKFTLQYQRPKYMIKTVSTISGLPPEHLCLDCWFPPGHVISV